MVVAIVDAHLVALYDTAAAAAFYGSREWRDGQQCVVSGLLEVYSVEFAVRQNIAKYFWCVVVKITASS